MSSRPPTTHSISLTTLQGISLPSPDVEPQVIEPSEHEIQAKPWKYVGYRGYSEFLASEDDLLVFRRFSVLNTRVLLSLQDKVCELEQKLLEIDKKYSKRDVEDFNNGTFRDDLPEREELLEEIAGALSRYNSLVLQQSSLRRYRTAPQRDVKNIKNWHYNHGYQAIAADERQYTQHTGDLISIAEKDKTPLRQFIDNVAYYSDKRINNFTSMTIVFIGITMLLTLIWILQALHSATPKLIVITIFILAFLVTLSYAMVTKPFEALGSTAAYAAVLMVFLQVGEAS
ncbi:phytase [Apiospora marii]|uniref:phytase n=1 Tax=Apiospora marii TaxID=335849 RepID=UPI00312D8FD7